mmetsp:Transcript_74497/g.235353  ORF Transcript_74497/g.235353 Transcript_74497/m.235353 type:complete len:308 (-) Transcript_74497:40-963(-)
MPAVFLPSDRGDPVGSETVLHGEPFFPDSVGPLPGAEPRASQLLASYRSYTRMDDWEARNRGLDKEVVPVKRHVLADYPVPLDSSLPEGQPHPEEAGEVEPVEAVETLEASAVQQLPRSARRHASGGSPAQVAGKMYLGLSSPRPAAAVLPGVSVLSPRGGAVRRRTGPVELPRQELPGRTATARPEQEQESPESPGLRPGDSVEIPLRVHTVQATQFAIDSPRDVAVSSRRPRHHRHHVPKVKDQDKMLRSDPKEMRASRKLSARSKQRLRELLGSPGPLSPRIEATDRHPSQAYGLVPLRNIRIT